MKYWNFLRQTLCSPGSIGALAPSSRALGAAMAQAALPASCQVIELGAGTGPVTTALLSAGLPLSQLVSVEVNTQFADLLRQRHPGLSVLAADAQDLPNVLASAGRPPHAEVIVSSLPWLSLPPAIQAGLCRAIDRVLLPGGRVVQFTYGCRPSIPFAMYSAAAWSVENGPKVWTNLPPARVHVYRRS